MEHNRAVEIQAVERYLLGEMPPDERNDFEEHYFTCAECAQDVRAAARFRANARELLRNPEQFSPPVEERRRGFSWWSFPSLVPSTVAVLLFGVVVYQSGFEIPSLKRQAGPQAIAEGAVAVTLRDTTRGAEGAKVTQIPRASGLISLQFYLISDEKQPSYKCTIMDASGKVMAAPAVEAPKGDEPAIIQLHREYFPPGPYSIVVRETSSTGGPARTIFKHEFEIN
jgi:hypothetical protein